MSTAEQRRKADDELTSLANRTGRIAVRTFRGTGRSHRFILAMILLVSSIAFGQSTSQSFPEALIDAALERTKHAVTYNGSYRRIGYPGGDVPDHIGVCTDVIIRAYRQLGVDLQELVHLDMRRSFQDYPNRWGLSRPDPNIDHRRVPNLQTFFTRHGEVLPVTEQARDYQPGDLVTWMLPGNLPHIGIVVDKTTADGSRHLIVHNVGQGPKLEDVLFRYEITGHYRYAGPESVSPDLKRLVERFTSWTLDDALATHVSEFDNQDDRETLIQMLEDLEARLGNDVRIEDCKSLGDGQHQCLLRGAETAIIRFSVVGEGAGLQFGNWDISFD